MTKTVAHKAGKALRKAGARHGHPDKLPDLGGELGDLAVRPEESPWTPEELAETRAELEADVARLRAEITTAETELAHLMRDSSSGSGDDQADVGTKAFSREHELSITNNAREMLLQSERALTRIANSSYGACESCSQPIGKARLQVFPRATLCVGCKQREERR